jgi:hypothetical protein
VEAGDVMAEMVRYGILPNLFTPGVLIDFYGNPLSAASSWPTVNGAGAGNLLAETAPSDTVGYNFTDQGSGGFNVTEEGSSVGINLIDQGGAGILIQESHAGNSGGIVIEQTTPFTGGVTISDAGPTGVVVQATGVGGITLDSAEGLRLEQIATPAHPLAGSDSLYFKSDDHLYTLTDASIEALASYPTALFGVGTAATGSPPAALVGAFEIQAGSKSVTFSGGAGTLTFPKNFSNGLLALALGIFSTSTFSISWSAPTVAQVTLNGGGSSTIDISFIAIGF